SRSQRPSPSPVAVPSARGTSPPATWSRDSPFWVGHRANEVLTTISRYAYSPSALARCRRDGTRHLTLGALHAHEGAPCRAVNCSPDSDGFAGLPAADGCGARAVRSGRMMQRIVQLGLFTLC